MNKEEILEKSREENKGLDPYRIESDNRAMRTAMLIILIFGTVMYVLNLLAGKGFVPEAYAPVAIFNAALCTSRYKNTEENKKVNLFSMVSWILASVMLAAAAVAKALS